MTTDPPTGTIPDAVQGALRTSGFPFQTAVERAVRNSPDWSVVAVEFPWVDPLAGEQFLDLVTAYNTLVLAIECKKTRNDTLTFLQPMPEPLREVDQAYLVYAEQSEDMALRAHLLSGVWGIGPGSAESAFCVVSTSSSGKDQRMLERDAQRLVKATDAYALHYTRNAHAATRPGIQRAFVPVIVTNAPLFVARYDPVQISLETGEFTDPPPDISTARWVRFRKSFTATGGGGLDERTVLVVNARYLADFLASARAIPREPTARARV